MIFSNKLNFVLAFIFAAVWASALADTVPHTKFRGTLVVTDLTTNYGQTGVIEFINNVTTYGEYVGNATRLVHALFPYDYLGQSTIHIAGCHGDDRTDESQTISHGMISRISLFDCNFRAIGNNGGDPLDYSSNLTVNLINVMGEQYCLPLNVLDNGRCVTPCICSELKDEATGNCYPMEKLSNWQDDVEFGVTYPYPENNHGVPRCKVSSLEVEPIDSLMCPASTNSTQTQNPIDCATGQKKYVQLDYQGYGLDALSLKRTYETKPKVKGILPQGTGWSFQFPRLTLLDRIQTTSFGLSEVYRLDIGDRYSRTFIMEPISVENNDYNVAVNGDGLVKPIYVNRYPQEFEFKLNNGKKYIFDNQLDILRVFKENGHIQESYFYDANIKLIRLENEFGRYLKISYDGAGNIINVTDQDGVEIIYQYANGNLKKILFSDNTPDNLDDNPFSEYLFEQSSLPDFITGIINEEGTRLANIQYDENARAILSELADGIERTEVSYPEEGKSIVKFYRDTTVNAYREELYTYGKYRGQYKLTSKTVTHCENCALTTEEWEYDARELLIEHTSPAGIVTQYLYDTQDRNTSVTIGVGSEEEKTMAYTWNETQNKIGSITTARDVTVFTFDTDGKLINTLITPVQ